MRWVFVLVAVLLVAPACGDEDGAGGGEPTRSSATTPIAEPTVAGWPSLARDYRSSFHNADETAISVEAARGLREAWSIEVDGFVAGVPAVSADGATVYALATGGLYALDASDGRVIWHNATLRGTASPTLHGGSVFVNLSGSDLVRVDAATGEEQWRSTIDEHP